MAHELAHVVQQGAGRTHIPGASGSVQRTADEDEKQTHDPAPTTPSRHAPLLTAEEAAARGREALERLGYHEIIRQAISAGLLAPANAGESRDTVQRTPAKKPLELCLYRNH